MVFLLAVNDCYETCTNQNLYVREHKTDVFPTSSENTHFHLMHHTLSNTHTWHHEKPMTVQNVLSLFHCDRGDEQDADLLQWGNRRLFLVFQGHWVMWSSCLRAYVKTVFMRVYIYRWKRKKIHRNTCFQPAIFHTQTLLPLKRTHKLKQSLFSGDVNLQTPLDPVCLPHRNLVKGKTDGL